LPILAEPSARSVPRWRCDWPIPLRTCVSFTFAIARHLRFFCCLDFCCNDGLDRLRHRNGLDLGLFDRSRAL
jgi:hypothetical protein